MREERQRAGLSQAALAEQLTARLDYKVDGSSVTRIEKGERGVRLNEAVEIAEVLGVPLTALLRDRAGIDAEIAELERERSEAADRATLAGEALQRERTAVRLIEEHIAALEGVRCG
jgi:transcriptional regulator with XRE-family HTH domain